MSEEFRDAAIADTRQPRLFWFLACAAAELMPGGNRSNSLALILARVISMADE